MVLGSVVLAVCCLVRVLAGYTELKADLTYVDLDVPPDDAVTVTGARGGRAALRKWRSVCNPEAAVEKAPFFCGGVETFRISTNTTRICTQQS